MAFDIDIGSDVPPVGTFDIAIGSTPSSAVAPGSTYDALAAGGGSWKWVVAIGGYPYLLTDAPTEAALDAWSAGGDWSQALGGLFVDHENGQRLNPWDPLTKGGKLTLTVVPDAADTFGIDTHRKTAGAETILTDTTLDSHATTITVLSTAAFASSGTAYIGNEAFTYSGKTATTFTGCTRGVFSPFATQSGSAHYAPGQFGQPHQLTTDPNAIRIFPTVSVQPRVWLGKWVGLWLHRYDAESGLLNTREDAQLVWAGRIVEIADDPSTMGTVVHCEHVNDYIERAVIGEDLWSAKLTDGIYLSTDMVFSMRDTDDGWATSNTADDLTVVTSGATPPNEINEGFYTNEEVMSLLVEWLISERDANNILGAYNIGLAPYGPAQFATRVYFSYRIPGSGPIVDFKFQYPRRVSRFFGGLDDLPQAARATLFAQPGSEDDTDYDRVGFGPPLRTLILASDFTTTSNLPKFRVEDERGTFVDQTGSLPSEYNPQTGDDLGIVIIGGKAVFGVSKNGDTLSAVQPVTGIKLAGQDGTGNHLFDQDIERTLDDETGTLALRQVLYHEGTAADVIKRLLYSSGSPDYNHADYDQLPAQLSVNIPGELLDTPFETGLDSLPGADLPFVLIVDEPITIKNLLTGTLTYRWSFLRWYDEHIEIRGWRTPTTGVVLSESNKAVPAGTEDDQRTASLLTDDWQRTTIKVDYDRDINAFDAKGGYRSTITLVDRTAIDDAGGDSKTITIQIRDAYGDSGVQSLKSQFRSLATLFTRPVRRQTRTIDSRFFESIGVGDCVLVTDAFARDPDTGQRGVAARPGIIVAHRWSLGGAAPNGATSDVLGEVDIMFLDVFRTAVYGPTAVLDDTATNSGYVVATKIATCYAHKHSETSESADASRFRVGAAIRFVERDPADPTSPDTHEDIVFAQSGNTITLTSGFAGFDNTKKYNIVLRDYPDSEAQEQTGFVWQADDADGMVSDDRSPFQYALPTPPSTWTLNADADPICLPADITYGDGATRDVGTDVDLNRLITNLIDYKQAMSLPWLSTYEMSGAAVTGSYLLVDVRPIWLSAETNTTTVTRHLFVAPFMKSSSGGSTATVRVSLVRNRPSGDDLNDIDRGAILAELEFSTTSATYAVPAAQSMNIGQIKNHSGFAYLLIELSLRARCKGLAQCNEGPRQAP